MAEANDYIVADIKLADFGRKELDIAETENEFLQRCSHIHPVGIFLSKVGKLTLEQCPSLF